MKRNIKGLNTDEKSNMTTEKHEFMNSQDYYINQPINKPPVPSSDQYSYYPSFDPNMSNVGDSKRYNDPITSSTPHQTNSMNDRIIEEEINSRRFLYVFRNAYGLTTVINYKYDNAALNKFLSMFDVWGSDGERKTDKDEKFDEYWFELPAECYSMFSTEVFKEVFRRFGVRVVFDYPFIRKEIII